MGKTWEICSPFLGEEGQPSLFAGRLLAGTLALPLSEEFTLSVVPVTTWKNLQLQVIMFLANE